MERRTKIIATIGPATGSPEIIESLIRRGINIARLNMSHAPQDITREHVRIIREVSQRLNTAVGVFMDIQGPAIRTATIPEEIALNAGDRLAFGVKGAIHPEVQTVGVNYDGLTSDLEVGKRVIVDNGMILMEVVEIVGDCVVCQVITDGILGSRRHINLPGVHVGLPGLTEKDLCDVDFGLEIGVDFFGMSFARKAADVAELRGIIDAADGHQQIIAKIENQQGVSNLDEIIDVADGIMVARGDLGIECPYEEIPVIQRAAVRACRAKGKPVIVATHMLESMVESPSPTRAEVTDIAAAVNLRTDAIMLSGETSVGKYPLRCVEVMDRVARRIEQQDGLAMKFDPVEETIREKLMVAAAALADNLGPKTPIVVFTRSGRMARHAAWQRPGKSAIYAFTDQLDTFRQIALLWGVTPFLTDLIESPAGNATKAMEILKKRALIHIDDTLVFVGDAEIAGRSLKSLQLHTVD